MEYLRHYEAQKAAAQAAHSRTLEEHDAHLRQFGTGDADYMAKRDYMLDHGLEYRDQEDGRRVLTWRPSTAYSESAYDARQRAASVGSSGVIHLATSGVAPPLNAPVPPSEQMARTTAGHAEHQRAVGGILGHGGVQQSRSPDKMFSRETIVAILKGQKCLNDSHMVPAMREGGDDVLRSLIRIFENLE